MNWIYYPKEKKSSQSLLTADFEKILQAEAIIIASPTPSHFEYLKQLRNFTGYILLEKPAVSREAESIELERWPDDFKNRLKINYNFQNSYLASFLNSLLKESAFGNPISLSIFTSHGLAFLDKYPGSWRSDLRHSFGVLELVGVHFIHLALSLFGEIKDLDFNFQWQARQGNNFPPDTVFLKLKMADNVVVNLYHSYAGPYLNRFLFLGTNGYFEYDGRRGSFYSPRECYNNQGRFKTPPIIKEFQLDESYIWQESLRQSLKDFFQTVRKKSFFSQAEFKNALSAMIPVFITRQNIENKINSKQ